MRAAEAVAAYEQAGQTEWSFVDEALARADLALARASRGELEGARAALARGLALPSQKRGSCIVTSVMRVHLALRDARYRGSSSADPM